MTEMPPVPPAPAHTQAPVQLLSLYAETSLHPGSGSSTGVIDLPVQREAIPVSLSSHRRV